MAAFLADPAAAPPPADAAADKTPWPVQVLVRLWPALQLWLFVSGRAPGLSREARWFMGQRYLSPELSVSFLGFAGRLVQPNRRHEDPEQVAKLLVHAFLEDLRCAYRRRLLRPSSWRRTAYPVVLLKSVEPGGVAGEFLRTVNDIRNDTGMFDPLAVVATMTDAPDNRPVGEIEELFAEPPGRTGAPRGPLAQWRDTIGALRRRHADGAWYLVLSLPDSLVRSAGALPAGPGSLPPLPPFWTRRRQVVALVAVVVLLAAAVPVARSLLPEQAPCESHPGTVIRAGECAGYSADDRLTLTICCVRWCERIPVCWPWWGWTAAARTPSRSSAGSGSWACRSSPPRCRVMASRTLRRCICNRSRATCSRRG
ncbi:hypothetical protein [Nocardia wallacei]|uniref:hypothetical protein n=1 Tax=Nocardia wallacei TaxID=480035 RepID=UPI002453C040|nr:hypothetical protein [Nocardia wallacei]